MKYIISFLSIFFFFGCSKDDTTGSQVFMSEDLVVLSTSVAGETVTMPAGDVGAPVTLSVIHIRGTVDSQSNLDLGDLRVFVRVLGENGTLLGMGEEVCSPALIAAGGSCTFEISVTLDTADYKTSQTIEITPGCNRGNGTLRLIPVNWPDS